MEAELAGEGEAPDEISAAARLSAGDVELARFLLSAQGRSARAQAEGLAATAIGEVEAGDPPWKALLDVAERAGEEAETATRELLEDDKEAGVKRSARDIADAAKRAGRRRRTELLDLGLALTAAWLRDLAAVAAGAVDVAYNRDRLDRLQAQVADLVHEPPSGAEGELRGVGTARRAAELVQDTRRRLDLNVSEELALEALSFRLWQEVPSG